ncbi:MAG: hypothetical protein H7A23_25935 [Leptospiraceae bacterium]|nr:hypothetical protein [Leptospiraceae bacterium]
MNNNKEQTGIPKWKYFIFLSFFCSCMTLSFPDKTTSKFDKPSKIQSWNNSTNNMPENFIPGGHVEISFNHNMGNNTPWWGKIGMLNLCLIFPCIDKIESDLYITYNYKGQELLKEKIRGNSYTISTLLLLPYSLFFQDENKEYKIRNMFESKVYPYIQSKLIEADEKRKKIDNQFTKKLKEYNLKKNKNCKYIYDFRSNNSEMLGQQQSENMWSEFSSCINKRVYSLTSKKYPFLSQHLSKEIFFPNETSTYNLIDLFNAKYLSIIPETGYKLTDSEFYFQKTGNNSFTMNIVQNGSKMVLPFSVR